MRKQLRKSDIRELQEKVEKYGVVLSKKDKIEITDNLILSNNIPIMFLYDEQYIPTLKSLLNGAKMKNIIVDMGAVKFVVSGADIMRPGIVSFDDTIEKDDFVVILDENNKKPLAVGKSLLNSTEITSQDKGKTVKNLHYVGDEIWSLS